MFLDVVYRMPVWMGLLRLSSVLYYWNFSTEISILQLSAEYIFFYFWNCKVDKPPWIWVDHSVTNYRSRKPRCSSIILEIASFFSSHLRSFRRKIFIWVKKKECLLIWFIFVFLVECRYGSSMYLHPIYRRKKTKELTKSKMVKKQKEKVGSAPIGGGSRDWRGRGNQQWSLVT